MSSLLSLEESQCTRCGACAAVCPMALVRVGRRGPRTIPDAAEKCILCGHCLAACPVGTLRHSRLPSEELPPLEPGWRGSPAGVRQLIQGRRSLRRYEDRPVDRAVLQNILDMARYAPTGMNSQPVCWLVVYEAAEVRKLSAAVIDWMRSLAANHEWIAGAYNPAPLIAGWDAGVDTILRGCPHVLIASAPNHPLAHDACTAALITAELAALPFGLGTCWAGFLHLAARSSSAVQELLALPENRVMHGALMIGYPRETYYRIPPRNPPAIEWR